MLSSPTKSSIHLCIWFIISVIYILISEAVPSTREMLRSPRLRSPRLHQEHFNAKGNPVNITRFNALISGTDIEEPRLISEESKRGSSFVLDSRSSSVSRSRSHSPFRLLRQSTGNPRPKRGYIQQGQQYALPGSAETTSERSSSVRSSTMRQSRIPDRNREKRERFESNQRKKTHFEDILVACIEKNILVVATFACFAAAIVIAIIGL